MKQIDWEDLVSHVTNELRKINIKPSSSLETAMNQVFQSETGYGLNMIEQVLLNYREAEQTGLPLCQDTGQVVMHVTLGTEVRIIGGSLIQALDEGIRRAYRVNRFRNSIISDPLFGNNTGDNTPGVYTCEIVSGETFRIDILIKGGGCDNLSSLHMGDPGRGPEGVESFLLRVIEEKASQACPPLIIGVGLGGSGSSVMHVAHRALQRPLGIHHPDERYRRLEERWKEAVNSSGIGPQGVGGKSTCLEVRIEARPCHIASFPMGIMASCHVFRQASLEWSHG